ncbi:MAG: hypothetical protein ABIP54_05000 [Candidatus Andersenbacteria bacterium]
MKTGTAITFLRSIDNQSLKTIDRAHAILWWIGRTDSLASMSALEICKTIEEAGHPRQNASRIAKMLSSDRKNTVRVPGKNTWRLHPHSRGPLNDIYSSVLSTPKPLPLTDSVLPRSLFSNTRSYIEKIVFQINSSYDYGLFDCTAVMCRRILETLLIETYEAAGRVSDVQDNNGNFKMFADLLNIFEQDKTFTMSRNGRKGLQDFKRLGDLSAHNRRYNARKEDIDRVRDGIRIASEELLHISGLI